MNSSMINILLAFSVLLVSCSSNPNFHQSKEMQFYARGTGGGDDGTHYYDYVALQGYEDKTANELFKLARIYIDTVKADNPVRGVTFLKNSSCCDLPAHFSSSSVKEFEIVTFIFDQRGKQLILAGVWFEAKGKMFSYNWKIDEKSVIDSLFKIRAPLIQ